MIAGTEGTDAATERPQWVTLAEAAAILRKSRRTIRRWVAEGRLPSRGTPDGRMVDVAAFLSVGERPETVIGGHSAANERTESAKSGQVAEVARLRTEAAMLRSQLADVTADKDTLARDVADWRAKAEALTQQVAALTDERDYLRRAHEASLVLARESQRALPAPHKRPWWRFWERDDNEPTTGEG